MRRRQSPRQKYDRSVYRSLVLVTQFGINMLVPIGITSAAGIWLDRRFGTGFWTVLLFFVGAAAGARNIYRMSKQIYGAGGKKEPDSVYEDRANAEKQK